MEDTIFLVCDVCFHLSGEREGRMEYHDEVSIDVASVKEGKALAGILSRSFSHHYYKTILPNRLMRPNEVLIDYRQERVDVKKAAHGCVGAMCHVCGG